MTLATPLTPPDDVTFVFDRPDGLQMEVTVDFDFTGFTPADVARCKEMAGDDGRHLILAFLFVKIDLEVALPEEWWPDFRDQLEPIFDGDGTPVRLFMED